MWRARSKTTQGTTSLQAVKIIIEVSWSLNTKTSFPKIKYPLGQLYVDAIEFTNIYNAFNDKKSQSQNQKSFLLGVVKEPW